VPCDSVSTMRTVYKAENFEQLKAAAEALGFSVAGTTERAIVRTNRGAIVVIPGQTIADRRAQKDAEKLMKGYAEEVFNGWVEGYPDTYQEQDREADVRVFTVGGSDPYGGY